MKKISNICLKFVTTLGILLALSNAQASTVSLSPVATAVNVSDVFTLDFTLDLSDTNTTGGGIDFSWDSSIIQYNNNFTFDSGVIDASIRDTSFDVIDFQQPGLLSIGFGNFAGISPSGLVGSIEFSAVGSGSTDVTLANSLKWAGFFTTVGGVEINPIFTNATVTTTTVPLPASIWLMISGLVAISGFSIRKTH